MDTLNNIVIGNPQKSSKFDFVNLKKSKLVKYLSILGVFLSILTTAIVAQNIKDPLSLFTKAVAGKATIELSPENSTLPPERDYQLWVNTDRGTSFIRASVSFDPTKILVSKEPEITLAGFNKIVWTSMSDANSSGNLVLVAGLDTSLVNNPPIGALRFAKISFKANPTAVNGSVGVNINVQDSQVIDIDTSTMAITGRTSNISISTAVYTPTASPTSTANATSTASPTSTGSANPTASPSPASGFYSDWDIDQNNTINIVDIGLVIDDYGNSGNLKNPRSDVNKNGSVDIIDIGIIIDHFE